MNAKDDGLSLPLLVGEREACRLLQLSQRTLFALRQRGELPFLRIGSAIRYDPADLRAWIDRQRTTGEK